MIVRFVLFLVVSLVLFGAAHLWFYRRLVRDVTPSPRARRLGAAVLVLLGLTPPGALLVARLFGGHFTSPMAWAAFLWLGLSLLLCVTLGAGEVVLRVARRLVSPALSEGRRRFLSQAVATGALTAAGGLGGYGVYRAFAAPEITTLPIKLDGLPRALDGLTLVQLTDVHIGHFAGPRFVKTMVERANALKPDLIALTGDFVDGSVEDLGSTVAQLRDLRSRYGSYFITGNHEFYSGDVEWCRFFEQLGVNVLRNRSMKVAEGGLELIGVDDWGYRGAPRRYDLGAALAGRAKDRPRVLLAHQPSNFEEAVAQGVDLQLSGHVHGGQVFPFTLAVRAAWRYAAGLYAHGEGKIYVSRGCGCWGPPMRVGSAPEIVKVVLHG